MKLPNVPPMITETDQKVSVTNFREKCRVIRSVIQKSCTRPRHISAYKGPRLSLLAQLRGFSTPNAVYPSTGPPRKLKSPYPLLLLKKISLQVVLPRQSSDWWPVKKKTWLEEKKNYRLNHMIDRSINLMVGRFKSSVGWLDSKIYYLFFFYNGKSKLSHPLHQLGD